MGLFPRRPQNCGGATAINQAIAAAVAVAAQLPLSAVPAVPEAVISRGVCRNVRELYATDARRPDSRAGHQELPLSSPQAGLAMKPNLVSALIQGGALRLTVSAS